MFFRKSFSSVLPVLVISILALIYIAISWIVSQKDFSITHLAYYNYLLSALYHKRVYVTPFLSTADLAWLNGKWYLYWGPAPILFIAPFYFFGKTQTSDVIYTLAAGILNIFLFYLVVFEFNKVFDLKKSVGQIIFILVNFALISPHFYLALQGRIWHTNQIIATLFLLVFLFFYFKFLRDKRRLLFLSVATIFLNLAVLSRYTLVFYFTLLLPLLWEVYKDGGKRLLSQSLFIIFSLSISFFGLMLIYNHARFGKIFETGVRYVNIRSSEHRYIEEAEKKMLISPKYFSHNFQVYFLNHLKLMTKKPFLEIDKEGNSLISIYPLALLTPLLFLPKFSKGKKNSLFLKTALFGVILPILIYLLFYLATGWAQLGTRYFLDIVPLLFVLLLVVVEYVPLPIKVVIVLYGVLVNLDGAILFYAS